MSTDQTTTSVTTDLGCITEEHDEVELHHISEENVCNTVTVGPSKAKR